jgi:membrane protease YdiL (CAAX protease family)
MEQTVDRSMEVNREAIGQARGHSHLSARGWVERIVSAFLFVVIGGFIIIVFSPWGKGPLLDKVDDYLAKIGVSVFLLAAALLARRSTRFQRYWQLLFACFILTVTVSLQWVFGVHIDGYLGVHSNTPAGNALQKLNECFVVVSVVIALTLLSGGSLGSIYVQKGKLKLGLIIGITSFVLAAAGSIPMAALLFNGEGLTLARVLPWTPWILIFVLANGTLEELMFRGLFLRKLEPFFGKFFSVFLVALVFTVLHRGAYYTSDQYIFLAAVFPLALAWGYIMQKTDSVWGSILFHAGMDIPIVLGLFWNLR